MKPLDTDRKRAGKDLPKVGRIGSKKFPLCRRHKVGSQGDSGATEGMGEVSRKGCTCFSEHSLGWSLRLELSFTLSVFRVRRN